MESKNYNKPVNITKKKQTDRENKIVVTGVERKEERGKKGMGD